MKILIIGNDINSRLLAQYIKMQDNFHDIYMTGENTVSNEYYTCININENDIQNITDFVKYNQIEFTITFSQTAIINGAADIFKKEGFPIFAPFCESARITYFNSIAKKIMYKLKINTPKFGIFDRENLALEYIRKSKFPIVIENDFTLFERRCNIYNTFSKAKTGLQKIFENNNEKIVIENYIDTSPLYVYFITDGYNALKLISLERSSGNGYTTTSAPTEKISYNITNDLLKTAIYPLLDDIAKFTGSYTGIIGLKIKLQNNKYNILEFYNGFQHYDFQAFLSLFNGNLLQILYNAANGGLNNKKQSVELTEQYSYTAAVNKNKLIKNTDYALNDFIESEDENKIIITNTASTMNYAKNTLLEYIKDICDTEIYEDIINSENKKETTV